MSSNKAWLTPCSFELFYNLGLQITFINALLSEQGVQILFTVDDQGQQRGNWGITQGAKHGTDSSDASCCLPGLLDS